MEYEYSLVFRAVSNRRLLVVYLTTLKVVQTNVDDMVIND
jgi:hypothetical protein